MRKIETLEMALERIKELEAENQKLNEELEYYRTRKAVSYTHLTLPTIA